MLGIFTNALHAVSVAVLVNTSLPETLSEFDELFTDVFGDLVGDGI